MATPQELQNALIGIRNRFQNYGANGESMMLQAMADYARANGIPAAQLSQAAQAIAPNPQNWSVDRIQQTMSQFAPQAVSNQQAGLMPAMSTIQQAGETADKRLEATQEKVGSLFNQGVNYLNPYSGSGSRANDLAAAYTGALGGQAQKDAFANFTNSPGVQFAQQQGEKAILRNAAALGRLGGGNTLTELNDLAANVFLGDFNNQFGNLSTVADRGYGAATTQAGLRASEAGIANNLGQAYANVPLQTASMQAPMQFQAGRDLSQNIAGTTTALANLQNTQGMGQADLINGQAGNINQLYQQAVNGDNQARAQLAGLLTNLNSNAMSAQNGAPSVPVANTNYLGQIGQISSGVAGFIQGTNNQSTSQTFDYAPRPVNNPVTGFGPNYNVPYSPNYLTPRF